jgi:hypothetical protein
MSVKTNHHGLDFIFLVWGLFDGGVLWGKLGFYAEGRGEETGECEVSRRRFLLAVGLTLFT